MAIAPGTRLGAYEIDGLLGAGGMGEVYRARDTKLGRDVALKILPAVFAQDPDRLARFDREARALAALDHPGIATIYGAEQFGDVHALIMELVDGPTLGEKLEARGALSIDEALTVAAQVAEAVASAHERGIIHRDLKPANIKLRTDGAIKVLDFGLAKALGADAASGAAANSSTNTSPADLRQGYGGQAMTQAGVLLGTAAYMSPEQARGEPADRRADVWAFGCVLFELLTARRAFEAATMSDTIAGVLRADPDWLLLPHDVPASIVRLLKRCLAKERKQRLSDLNDARLDLAEAMIATEALIAESRAPAPSPARSMVLVGAVAVLAAAGGWFAGSGQRPPLALAEPLRFSVARMAVGVVRTSAEGLTVSSDGRHVVFVGSRGSERRLFRRALDSDAVEEVPGTERAASPFSSPDGKWIGYFEGTTVKKVAVGGGVPITVCSRPQTFGQASATWLEDDTVVVGIAAGADDVAGLYRCGMSGGPATRLDASIRPTAVSRVPGRPRVILAQTGGRADGAIHLVDLDSGRIARLMDGATPQVVPPDLLVFTRDEAIWATHFDIAAGTLSDDVVQVADGLSAVGPRNPLFATSTTGTAAFVSRLDPEGELVWVDRQGAATPFAIRPDGEIRHPALSPDGRTLAFGRTNREGEHVWLVDLERQTMARLTTRMASRRPVWKPDGLSITFQGYGSAAGIFEATVGDQEAPRPILVREPGVGPLFPDAWTPDGRTLAIARNEAPRDLMLFSDGKLEPLLDSPANERGAAFSPDGRHMVFVSNETGRDEVYLQPYPGRGGRTTVSTGGGTEPAWSRDGRELFYREASRMIAVSFDPSTGRVGAPRLLFEASESDYRDDGARPAYVVAPDGRFVMIRNTATNGGSIQVVVNFVTEVRRRLEQGGPRQ